MITQERLKELVSYDPKSGLFTRNISVRGFGCEKGSTAGSKNKHGYVDITIDGKKYKSHRLAFLFMTGKFPDNEVDHINRVRDDNRWCNLRQATSEEQKWNTKVHAHNSTGVKGVSWDNSRNLYRASITCKGKFFHIGFFDSVKNAEQARVSKEAELRGCMV